MSLLFKDFEYFNPQILIKKVKALIADCPYSAINKKTEKTENLIDLSHEMLHFCNMEVTKTLHNCVIFYTFAPGNN